MMRRNSWMILILVLLFSPSIQLHAEVSANRLGDRSVSTLMMDLVAGITDGADPIPQLRWIPYRKVHPRWILNPSGAIRRDGRPDLSFHQTGIPFATWAWNNGGDHDIAFAHWTGDRWSDTQFLTHDAADQVDPRIHVTQNGVAWITWAVAGDESKIMVSAKHVGDTSWSPPLRLTAPNEMVSRPTIVAQPGAAWVAYERFRGDDGDVTPRVAVRRVTPDESLATNLLFPTTLTSNVDPILHFEEGTVWMEWKFGPDRFAWVVLEGEGQGALHLHPWTDTSWVGVEAVRLEIRRRVLGRVPVVDPADETDSSGF